MENLINDILSITQNYRKDDLGFDFNKDHVLRWVRQFDDGDQYFLLSELRHLLPKSYLSKEDTFIFLENLINKLSEDLSYASVQDFLDHSLFLDCQAPNKSQKVFLGFIEEVLLNKYAYYFAECGKKGVENWIYIDDILASGRTFQDDIKDCVESYSRQAFFTSNIRVIAAFVVLHSWGFGNSRYILDLFENGKQLGSKISFYRAMEVENDPRVNRYVPSQSFNHIYPLSTEEGIEILEYIENSSERDYDMKNENYAFRNIGKPLTESYFSSVDNRNRYERILLSKGYEILKRIGNPSLSTRPLGFTPPSYKTLGTGTHFFTWRNISNTCPLVFWWEYNDWYPLFPVHNRGIHVDELFV